MRLSSSRWTFAYVPVAALPGGMQACAGHEPLTSMVETAGILTVAHGAATTLGPSIGDYLPVSLLWSAAIVACAPLARGQLVCS